MGVSIHYKTVNYITEIKSEPISNIEIVNLFESDNNAELNCEFVRVKESNSYNPIINLKIQSDYSPTFKQSDIVNGIILVGYGEKFAMFDLNKNEKLTELHFDGYFSEFNVDGDDVFVASDCELINLTLDGKTKWRTENLGIDGVVIHEVSSLKINGSGEWDPPGGWEDFEIDRKTGKKN